MNKSQFFRTFETLLFPKFIQFSKILSSGDRAAISEILSPGIEIYKGDKTIIFADEPLKEVRLIEIHTGGDGLESLRIEKENLK